MSKVWLCPECLEFCRRRLALVGGGGGINESSQRSRLHLNNCNGLRSVPVSALFSERTGEAQRLFRALRPMQRPGEEKVEMA